MNRICRMTILVDIFLDFNKKNDYIELRHSQQLQNIQISKIQNKGYTTQKMADSKKKHGKKGGHRRERDEEESVRKPEPSLFDLDAEELKHLQMLKEKYRDRAKERLDGITAEEEAGIGLLEDDTIVKVKGLDFDLLEKERAAMRAKDDAINSAKAMVEKAKADILKAQPVLSDIEKFTKNIMSSNIQRLMGEIANPPKKDIQILKDNCVYIFDLDSVFGAGAPNLLQRNTRDFGLKNHDQENVIRIIPEVPEHLIKNLGHTLANLGKKPAPSAKKEEVSDDDEDIFGNVSKSTMSTFQSKMAGAKDVNLIGELKKDGLHGNGKGESIPGRSMDIETKSGPAEARAEEKARDRLMDDLMEDEEGNQEKVEKIAKPAISRPSAAKGEQDEMDKMMEEESADPNSTAVIVSRLLQKRKKPEAKAPAPRKMVVDSYEECYPEDNMTLEEMKAWKQEQGVEKIFGEYKDRPRGGAQVEKEKKGKGKGKNDPGQQFDKIQKMITDSKAGGKSLPKLS